MYELRHIRNIQVEFVCYMSILFDHNDITTHVSQCFRSDLCQAQWRTGKKRHGWPL